MRVTRSLREDTGARSCLHGAVVFRRPRVAAPRGRRSTGPTQVRPLTRTSPRLARGAILEAMASEINVTIGRTADGQVRIRMPDYRIDVCASTLEDVEKAALAVLLRPLTTLANGAEPAELLEAARELQESCEDFGDAEEIERRADEDTVPWNPTKRELGT